MYRLIARSFVTFSGATTLLLPAIFFQSLLPRPAHAAMCLKPTGEIVDCVGGSGGGFPIPIRIRDPHDPPDWADPIDPPDQCQMLPRPDCSRDGDDIPHTPPRNPHPFPLGNQAIDPSIMMNLGSR